MKTDRIVLINREKGFMIWDTIEKSYIGLRQGGWIRYKGKESTRRGIKNLWSKAGYAKSAFKEHTGCKFDDQTRYVIKEIK